MHCSAAKQTTKTTARIRRDLGVCCESIVIIWNVFMLVSLILPFLCLSYSAIIAEILCSFNEDLVKIDS